MTHEPIVAKQSLPHGVMLNAYPDSIGARLADTVDLLQRPQLQGAFSLFYILPTFFNSDLDRGFSVIDYNLNPELVSSEDLQRLRGMNIEFKLDMILNHLSVMSPQFQDLLARGNESEFRDFFVDWDEFWREDGTIGEDGFAMPSPEHLARLFMRKPGLPILKVRFPDGTERPYWNTFYQDINYGEVALQDLASLPGIATEQAQTIAQKINDTIRAKRPLEALDLGELNPLREQVISIIESKRQYLGQMDLNARSEKVWEFYDETLRKLRQHGARIVRLDAFAYLHKEPGQANFFNRPGTWDYLDRLRSIAEHYDLIIFPEVHAEYGAKLHEEVAEKGFPIYDFFFPGLVADALERGTKAHLLTWVQEIAQKGLKTINMLGCHDGIPLLDLRGKEIDGIARSGLLTDEQIDGLIERVVERGGRIKNLYGPDGKKIAYYQVNATYFSALGEDERKLRLARAIQMFMPGIPQVWYLDLFAGTNDYEAADRGGPAGHKEINRTNLSMAEIDARLERPVVRDQLEMIRLRNTSPAFDGMLEIDPQPEHHLLTLTWRHQGHMARLIADLRELTCRIEHHDDNGRSAVHQYC